MKLKGILLTSALTAMLGVGIFAGVSGNKGAAPVEKTEAATANISGIRVFFDDQTNAGFTYNGGDPYIHMTSVTFASGSGYTSVSDVKNDAFGSSISIGSNYIDVKMTWSSGGTRPYEVVFPWYIQSFTGEFYAASSNRILCNKAGGARVSVGATKGNEYKVYAGNWSGCDWNGDTLYASISQPAASSYNYDETTYSVTISKTGTGTVSPSGTATYNKNQILNLTATPGDGWSFAGWSDSGAQSHRIYVTSSKTYSATFNSLPKLATPSVTNNNGVISWSSISNAVGYRVDVNGETTEVDSSTLSLDIRTNKVGTYVVQVTALGNGTSYNNSDPSSEVQYVVVPAYYLVGSFNDWVVSGDSGEIKATTDGDAHTVTITTETNNVTAKLVKFEESSAIWFTPNQSTSDMPYPVSVDGGNIKFEVAGTYTLEITNCDASGNDRHADYAVASTISSPYSVTIGNSTVPMVSVARNGNDEQYKATVTDVAEGQNVSFKKNASSQAATAEEGTSNNIDVVNNILLNGASSVDVYLKKNGSNYSYFVTNRSAMFYLSVWPDFHAFVVNTQAPEGNYMYTGIEFEANTEFKLYCAGYFAPTGANFINNGLGFTSDGTKITCTTAGTYNLFIDNTGANAVLSITGQSAADLKATAFSNAFLDAYDASRGGICNADGSTGAAYESSISSTWTTLMSNYNTNVKDNTDAVNILKNANPAADTTYGKFAALYDKIYGDYATKLSLANFASRSVTPRGEAFVGNLQVETSSTVTTMATVVAGVMAVSTAAGFLFLKKKKNF